MEHTQNYCLKTLHREDYLLVQCTEGFKGGKSGSSVYNTDDKCVETVCLIPRVGHFRTDKTDEALRGDLNAKEMREVGNHSRSQVKISQNRTKGDSVEHFSLEDELMKCVCPNSKAALEEYLTVKSSFLRATVANWVAAKIFGDLFQTLTQEQRQALLHIIMGHQDPRVTKEYTWIVVVDKACRNYASAI